MTNPQLERQQVTIRFADLRQLATAIPPYLAQKVGVAGTHALSTAIEDDFGIAGLDTESLLLEFGADYHVDLTKFDFTDFRIGEPGVGAGLLFFPKVLLLLSCWLAKVTVALLVWPVSAWRAKEIWDLPALSFWFPAYFPAKRPPSEVLTVGDFVASAALGYVVKRERVRFVLAASPRAINQ
jgi:hypothetical protein